MAGPLLPGSGGRRGYRPPMADINITPFVDVMLVLLVVFMITAPLITQGVQVSLPEVHNAPISDTKEPLQVTIKNDGSIYLQTQKLKQSDLVGRLSAIQKVKPDTSVLIKADQAVSYGKVMEVMAALQTAGLVDVGLLTQPPKGN